MNEIQALQTTKYSTICREIFRPDSAHPNVVAKYFLGEKYLIEGKMLAPSLSKEIYYCQGFHSTLIHIQVLFFYFIKLSTLVALLKEASLYYL